MTDSAASQPLDGLEAALAAVRAAGEGVEPPKAALAARQARAALPDVVEALAGLQDGSPAHQRARAELRELGVTGKALDASLRWWRAQRGRRVAEGRDDRPCIRCGSELHDDIAAGVAALGSDPDLYARGGALVRVLRGDGGELLVRPHTAATLRARLTRFARWEKQNESGFWEPGTPPDAVTLGILEAGAWEGIRVLVGLVETPTLRPDYTISQRPGYDPETRTLYAPTIEFPTVPDEPTQDDAREALRFAWVETSYDFPAKGLGYADPAALDADPDGVWRFVAARACPDAWGIVAAAMSGLARPAIVGNMPALIFTAPTPASGKGLQIDVVSTVLLGRIVEKFTWPTASERSQVDAEVEKRLAGALLDAAPVIVWDEVATSAFGGPSINNALTCGGRMKVRVIGSPNTPALPYSALMMAAGNNVAIRDNTHRRALMMALESPDENPEEHRGWRRDPLTSEVLSRRPEIVVALLTVLRAYAVAGMPDTYDHGSGEMRMPPIWGGGFEHWSRLVARAILWAGGGDVLACRSSAKAGEGNEERDAIGIVIDALARLEPKGDDGRPTGAGITMGGAIDLLYSRERMRGEAPPDGYDEAREAIEAITSTGSGRKPKAKALGDVLRAWKRRPLGGRVLDVAPRKDRGNVARWTVRQVAERKRSAGDEQ